MSYGQEKSWSAHLVTQSQAYTTVSGCWIPHSAFIFLVQLWLIFYCGIKVFSINHLLPYLCVSNSSRDLFVYFNLTRKSYSFLLLHPKTCQHP